MGLLLFLGSVACLSIFLTAKPRIAFALLLGGLIVFQPFFLQHTLFTVGGAKVYAVDLTMASLLVFLVIRLMRRRFTLVPGSLRGFLLFFGWGLIAIVRGLPEHGYSAVGEARWYVLPMAFYFFVVAAFEDSRRIWQSARWFLVCVSVMIVFHFFYYYFLGGKQAVPAPYWYDYRQIYRFIRARQVLLVAFAFVTLLLFYAVRVTERFVLLLYLVLSVFVVVIIVTQIRSVWLALATGLSMVIGSIIVRFATKGLPKQTVLLLSVSLLLIGLLGIVGWFVGRDVYLSIARSVSVFDSPTEDPTGSWRLEGWRQELVVAMRNPIAGQGLGGYSEWFDGQQWQRVAVHNGYIMFFSKFGAIGIVLLIASVALWYCEMVQYAHKERDERCRLLGYAIQICVAMHVVFAFFFDFTAFFWILLGAGTALVRIRRFSRSVPSSSHLASSVGLAETSQWRSQV